MQTSTKHVFATIVLATAAVPTFAPPAATADDDVANPSVAFVQRTFSRIAASSQQQPATVRWQFYGQSITAQPWTRLVEQDLARRFSSVKFVFHNPAIGGFTSPALIRTAEHDLYPWYPDLLVFHPAVCGNVPAAACRDRNRAGPKLQQRGASACAPRFSRRIGNRRVPGSCSARECTLAE